MSTLCPQQFLDSPYQLRPRYDMMLRRLFALGAAPLSHVAWCAPGDFTPAPPFIPRPGFLFRDGPHGKGYYRVANSPEAPSSPEPSPAPKPEPTPPASAALTNLSEQRTKNVQRPPCQKACRSR